MVRVNYVAGNFISNEATDGFRTISDAIEPGP